MQTFQIYIFPEENCSILSHISMKFVPEVQLIVVNIGSNNGPVPSGSHYLKQWPTFMSTYGLQATQIKGHYKMFTFVVYADPTNYDDD